MAGEANVWARNKWPSLREERGSSGEGVEGDCGEHFGVGMPETERKGQGEGTDEIPLS